MAASFGNYIPDNVWVITAKDNQAPTWERKEDRKIVENKYANPLPLALEVVKWIFGSLFRFLWRSSMEIRVAFLIGRFLVFEFSRANNNQSETPHRSL